MKTMYILLLLALFQVSCSSEDGSATIVTGGDTNGNDNPLNSQWTIPVNEIVDGGPGRDGIPALVNPELVSAVEASFMEDEDLVLLFKNGDDVRAYPHLILDWHEIVNDNIGNISVAITFCPLTGTGIGWGRTLNGMETTFGVSGLLYNTNLIPFDRLTDSNWSQILNESVNGQLIRTPAELYQLLETNWKTAVELYPNLRVVGTNTGFSRTYGTSPYGDYNTNNDLFLFPVPKDNRLPSKDKVLAILDDGEAKAYQFSDFSPRGSVIRDNFKGKDYLLIGNSEFIFSYALNSSQQSLDFQYLTDSDNAPDVLLEDNEGNLWNVFGEAISGPRTGEFLGSADAMMGQWFSIPAFYNTVLFGE